MRVRKSSQVGVISASMGGLSSDTNRLVSGITLRLGSELGLGVEPLEKMSGTPPMVVPHFPNGPTQTTV